MPFYHKLGDFPSKRHVAFRKEGGGIHFEHLMGNLGFTGLQSLLYTLRRPTTVKAIEPGWIESREAAPAGDLRMRHLRTHRLPSPGGSPVRDRVPLLLNDDIAMSLARPTAAETRRRLAWILVIAIIGVLISDILYAMLDPRIRLH